MDQYITRAEYEEHNKRMEDEHRRFSKRLGIVEEEAKTQTQILLTLERMGSNIETVTKEQARQGEMIEKQGKELEEMKEAPLVQMKNTRQAVINSVINILIGAVLGVILSAVFGI